MSLLCCPLQCGKYISSFNSHKNQCPNKQKLGKFCQQCPYNPEHVLSIKAMKVHVHFCPNKPKSSIFNKVKVNKMENITLKKGFPPYDIIRPKKSINSNKNIPFSLSEGSLKETSNVYQRNKSMINDNYKRLKIQEKKLLSYFVDNEWKEEEKKNMSNNVEAEESKGSIFKNKYENNSFLKLGQYKIIKKPSIKFTEDKARVSTTSEDTLSQKKIFYW